MDCAFSSADQGLLLEYMRSNAQKITQGNTTYLAHFLRAIDDFDSGKNYDELILFPQLRRYPVGLEEFMFGSGYLARPVREIFPAVTEELIKINNPNDYRLSNPYTEAVLTGGLGSAKTTTALYTQAYQLYLMSCFRDPHHTFGMDSTSEILIIFQSLTGGHAQSVDYSRFRAICEQSHYFRAIFPFDRNLKSHLKFPGRIEVKAIGSDSGAIGQNVIGGLIDEINFMAITEGSKKSIDRGVYNQALTIYNGIARRRKTRFLSAGKMPGILCLVSSKRYPGEFTDIKLAEAKKDPTIYVYDKRVWDVKPPGTYTQGWFDVFVGDLTRKARILEAHEPISLEDTELIVSVPEDYRQSFEDDMNGSLRDIAGVGTLARYPYIHNVQKVTEAFGKVESIFSTPETDFTLYPLQLLLGNLKDKELPRWVHIDLGLRGDAAGVAIGHVPGFKKSERINYSSKEEVEVMPIVRMDGVLRVLPPKNDEIKFYKIREILYILRDRGLNIKWITFDSYQSVDSIQILSQQGFIAGHQSVDTDNNPYDYTKAALYDSRLELPAHPHCQTEFLSLEQDGKTGKIDHPPEGSKDLSDAVAGVVYGLTMRREIWSMFNVSIQSYLDHAQRVKAPGSRSIPETQEEKHAHHNS